MAMNDLMWVVICSPVSGGKVGKKVVEEILLPGFEKQGDAPVVEVNFTQFARHAVKLTKNAVEVHGASRIGIVVVGGDGTIHEVLTGLHEKGALSQVPVAIVSQGTLNFFAVTAGLPEASKIPRFIASSSTRLNSLMHLQDISGIVNEVSFEAIHFGRMAFNVCKAAEDWRFSPGGPMAGIFKEIIAGNAAPSMYCDKGTLTLRLSSGKTKEITDSFFWIIVTHRNPYNGIVGEEMWVSVMPLSEHPGFATMMEFFEPPMGHFQGTKYTFGQHYACEAAELFVSDSRVKGVALVLDGSPFAAGYRLRVENHRKALTIVADEQPPTKIDEKFMKKSQRVTRAAQAFLNKHPPSEKLYPPQAKQETNSLARAALGVALSLSLVLVVMRKLPKPLPTLNT